ncbi:MAG: glucokinase, partial [Syntrophales bacterium LBB04]|nr:glucokinase [Syntrophales bacterium LBB04]
TFENALYPNLEEIIREFLSKVEMKADRACLGVAGPVRGNSAVMTNLPWTVDGKKLSRALHIPVLRIVNDLLAVACAVPFLTTDDLCTLNTGNPVSSGNMAVIAPGTGLGEAFLIRDGERYRGFASEGGHGDFAPMNELERELLLSLGKRFSHVSYDRLCSSRGLTEIYRFLRETGRATEPPELAARLAATGEAASQIVEVALSEGEQSGLSMKTLEVFTSILGAEAGNLGLKVLAMDGIYIAGSLSRRILPFLTEGRFMDAFLKKGRMSELLANIPVHVILNPAVALIGAARYLLDEGDKGQNDMPSLRQKGNIAGVGRRGNGHDPFRFIVLTQFLPLCCG